jgi:hypothetical protein
MAPSPSRSHRDRCCVVLLARCFVLCCAVHIPPHPKSHQQMQSPLRCGSLLTTQKREESSKALEITFAMCLSMHLPPVPAAIRTTTNRSSLSCRRGTKRIGGAWDLRIFAVHEPPICPAALLELRAVLSHVELLETPILFPRRCQQRIEVMKL